MGVPLGLAGFYLLSWEGMMVLLRSHHGPDPYCPLVALPPPSQISKVGGDAREAMFSLPGSQELPVEPTANEGSREGPELRQGGKMKGSLSFSGCVWCNDLPESRPLLATRAGYFLALPRGWLSLLLSG